MARVQAKLADAVCRAGDSGRSAVGMAALPMRIAVDIEAEVEIAP